MRISETLLREYVRDILLEQALDLSKNTADRISDELVQLSNGDLRRGQRKDRVNRLYPEEMDLESFVSLVKKNYKPKVLEVIPPGQSALGFTNSSGRFPAILFSAGEDSLDLVPVILARGRNLGEQYESDIFLGLKAATEGAAISNDVLKLISDIGLSGVEMLGANVEQTKPNPRKLMSEPYNVGSAIADIIVTPVGKDPVYLSIKNIAGSTFGNHGYAGGFVQSTESDGSIVITPGSGPGDTDSFIRALGIDKEEAARGFTNYANRNPASGPQKISSPDSFDADSIKSWLASGVGYGYYYVREKKDGTMTVKTLFSETDAKDFVGDVKSVTIRYPQGPKVSKQITAKVDTSVGMFVVEIRNSSGKIMPNEIKLRITKTYE